MKICCRCGVEKPVLELGAHARMKDGLRRACRACEAAACRAAYEKNKDARRKKAAAHMAAKRADPEWRKVFNAQHAKWRAKPENHALVKERAKQWALDNPERRTTAGKAYRAKNIEKMKAYQAAKRTEPSYRAKKRENDLAWKNANRELLRKRAAEYRKRHLDQHCANQARRRSLKLARTPLWANEFFISEAYHLAKIRSQRTGFKWHVDHIVPLKSPIVCGLHVEHNLAVIPGKSNISKSNRFWPDMP